MIILRQVIDRFFLHLLPDETFYRSAPVLTVWRCFLRFSQLEKLKCLLKLMGFVMTNV